MGKLQPTLSSHTLIRFQDCDPYQHLNNGRYIDYFLNAREDQVMSDYEINLHEMTKSTGVGWVITSNQIAYLKPAMLMEKVLVESQVLSYDEQNIRLEMRMYDIDRTHIKSVLWTDCRHFHIIERISYDHNDELMDMFKEILLEVDQKNFETRKMFLAEMNQDK